MTTFARSSDGEFIRIGSCDELSRHLSDEDTIFVDWYREMDHGGDPSQPDMRTLLGLLRRCSPWFLRQLRGEIRAMPQNICITLKKLDNELDGDQMITFAQSPDVGPEGCRSPEECRSSIETLAVAPSIEGVSPTIEEASPTVEVESQPPKGGVQSIIEVASPTVEVAPQTGPYMVSLRDIDLKFRPASEVRAVISREAVGRYLEAFDGLPPVRLVYDRAEKLHWVADGRHRLEAARQLDRTDVSALVTVGSYTDAYRMACHANDTHGLPATNADKRHRVLVALAHPEMCGWSDRRIADQCRVSPPFVGGLRSESTGNGLQLEGDPPLELSRGVQPKRLGKDGKLRSSRARTTKDHHVEDGVGPPGDSSQSVEDLPKEVVVPQGDEVGVWQRFATNGPFDLNV
jgi:hypothetical protein